MFELKHLIVRSDIRAAFNGPDMVNIRDAFPGDDVLHDYEIEGSVFVQVGRSPVWTKLFSTVLKSCDEYGSFSMNADMTMTLQKIEGVFDYLPESRDVIQHTLELEANSLSGAVFPLILHQAILNGQVLVFGIVHRRLLFWLDNLIIHSLTRTDSVAPSVEGDVQ